MADQVLADLRLNNASRWHDHEVEQIVAWLHSKAEEIDEQRGLYAKNFHARFYRGAPADGELEIGD